MLSIFQSSPVLGILFMLLNHDFVHTCTGDFLNPSSPTNKFANYEQDYSDLHPKLRKPVFGRINTIATAVTIAIMLLSILVYKLRENHEANLREKYKVSKHSCRRYLLADIVLATKGFDNSLVVGHGGFGKVYKGEIVDDDDGKIMVAIKRLNLMSKQGATEFKTEIAMLSKIRHSNIVSLIGFCDDCDEMILIYEFMVRGTLAENMHKNSGLSWEERVMICIGAARGLDYLHTGTGERSRIIHRDVKSSNILLSENWTAKISDFGLSKIGTKNELNSHISTNVKGTLGYMDPDYFLTHRLTRKSDVYAFGVVLFEVLCGRRAVDYSLDMDRWGLSGWAKDCIKDRKLDEIIDPILKGEILADSLTAYAQIADQCTLVSSAERPTMAEVVVTLERVLTLQEKRDSFDFNIGGFFSTDTESSGKSEAAISGAFNNQDEKRERDRGDIGLDDNTTSKVESGVKSFRKMVGFVKNVRRIFVGTSHVIPAHVEAQPLEHIRSNSVRNDPPLKIYTMEELKAATRNFKVSWSIRAGKIYRGWVDEVTHASSKPGVGMLVAIRIVETHAYSALDLRELKSKVEFWAKLHHPNLVKIFGYCCGDKCFFLVQEYSSKRKLENHLFRRSTVADHPLEWIRRLKIATQAARGLAFLHASQKEVVYYQFKTSAIFLDGDLNAKLSEYHVAKLFVGRKEECNPDLNIQWEPHVRVYGAPEYLRNGILSLKGDVYGFGVFMLEIMTGQRAYDENRPWDQQNLVEWAKSYLTVKTKVKKVIDQRLSGQYPLNCVFQFALLASKCIDYSPENRPSMEQVLATLEDIKSRDEENDKTL